jgi:DNA invertase Pin-like site-specific DNA recombinase
MAKNITVIPAKPLKSRQTKTEETPKTRVAAYCRVSTDSDEQATSYETQVNHYTEFIKKNPAWKFAGIYADDGISGTNTKKRENFNRMIDDCMNGKIDLVITKSISRFARNTLDCLKYIRKLKDVNIPVFFEKENINTMDAKGEVLITIMASLAQQESQSLSQNVKLGFQYRYQQGKVQVNHNWFLGYTKDQDGNLIIDPEEAKVVRRIYREYLEGASMPDIARGLMADGILTGGHHKKWCVSTIQGILSNEKYMGDALLQKTYTVDFLSKKRVMNNGIVPQYYVENSHPAIIPKEIYFRAQEEMYRRAHLEINGVHHAYSSKYALTCVVICGKCGNIYRRIKWNNRGKKSVVWRCCSRVTGGKKVCSARSVHEEVLHQAVLDSINQVFEDSSSYIEILQENLKEILENSFESDLLKIDKKLETKQEKLIGIAQVQGNYDKLVGEIDDLKRKKQEILRRQALDKGKIQRLKDMGAFIRGASGPLKEYDEKLVRRFIEKITIYDSGMEILFKSGIKINYDDAL